MKEDAARPNHRFHRGRATPATVGDCSGCGNGGGGGPAPPGCLPSASIRDCERVPPPLPLLRVPDHAAAAAAATAAEAGPKCQVMKDQ